MRRVKMVNINFFTVKKVKDSQAQGEDTQQAEFESESNQEDSNPNRNSEHRESSEVGGFD